MEIQSEDRQEPEVEVIHEPELHSSSGRQIETTQRSSLITWKIAVASLIGLSVLGLVFLMFLPPKIFQMQKTTESTEIKALKEEIQRLRAEINPLKNQIQALQTEQKAVQEQLAGLKEKIAVLTQKTETLAEHKARKKSITYKIKKGDTLNSIAQKFQVHPEDIRHWNQLPAKGNPKPGRRITIYPSTDS